MFLVDSHCHLDALNYKTLHHDITDMIDKASARSVKLMLAVSTTLPGFHAMTSMIGRRENVLFSCGIHPLNLEEPFEFSELHQLASSEDVVALGETGLDYYYQENNKVLQKAVFREHIRLGRELKKPVIVHTRSACEDTLAILREGEHGKDGSGVLHCFTEDLLTAKILLDIGFYISFSGIVTFPNTDVLRAVVRYVPLDRILVETDAPYLTPVPYRGKENQPAYVRDVAEFIAVLKGVPLPQLAAATTANFGRLFQVKIKP
ncbi:metal-dependent hydrolase [Candidatus Steffania adelgidicola]|uniref:metal-dependent hydrolase n=1 Tax=Candidatus Steffania adelgidicola TaxID=1076626 RepID=UPI001D034B82|nr:metal-dependent hydrolase [Candidatus Steffania adelgidicola]UDG79901.1 putative metal-dependent hydrolase YcfH [Candidatus Steffania adelgidicola]